MKNRTDIPEPLRRAMIAWSGFDTAGYVAAFGDGFRTSDPSGETSTREGLAEQVRVSAENWQSMECLVDDLIVRGDRIALSYTARMVGRANGWEGQVVDLPCITLVRIADDRIVEWKETFDSGVLRRTRLRKDRT